MTSRSWKGKDGFSPGAFKGTNPADLFQTSDLQNETRFVVPCYNSQTKLMCVHISHLVYPSVDGHLGCFQFLAVMSSAVRNAQSVCVDICFQFSAVDT